MRNLVVDGFGDIRVWVIGILYLEFVQYFEELVGFFFCMSCVVVLDEQQQFGWGVVFNGGFLYGEVVVVNGIQCFGGVFCFLVGDFEDEFDEYGYGESVVDYGCFFFFCGVQKFQCCECFFCYSGFCQRKYFQDGCYCVCFGCFVVGKYDECGKLSVILKWNW